MADALTDCFGDSITQYLAVEAEVLPSPTLTAQQMVSGLKGLFLHHLLQLRCNSHSVSVVEVEHPNTTSSGEAMEAGTSGEGLVETTKELQLGSALYPTASLFNHSCWPNVIFRYGCIYLQAFSLYIPMRRCTYCAFRFTGNTVAVVATKPIEKGEEINNCYGMVYTMYIHLTCMVNYFHISGPQVGRMKCPDRLAELKKKYFFDCTCPACTQYVWHHTWQCVCDMFDQPHRMDPSLDHRERVMDAYGCSECGGILKQGTVQWVCCGCGRTIEKSAMEHINEVFTSCYIYIPMYYNVTLLYVQLLREAERMFTAAVESMWDAGCDVWIAALCIFPPASPDASLPLLLKCQKLQSHVLHKHNMQLARTSDAVAHAYACQGKQKENLASFLAGSIFRFCTMYPFQLAVYIFLCVLTSISCSRRATWTPSLHRRFPPSSPVLRGKLRSSGDSPWQSQHWTSYWAVQTGTAALQQVNSQQ